MLHPMPWSDVRWIWKALGTGKRYVQVSLFKCSYISIARFLSHKSRLASSSIYLYGGIRDCPRPVRLGTVLRVVPLECN